MSNNYESVSELLEKKHVGENVKSIKDKKENKQKNKWFGVKIVALITAGIVALSSGIAVLANHLKKKDNDTPLVPDTSVSTMDIDDLGNELTTNATTNTTYKVVSGNIDSSKIVEQDGKLYADEDSASKAKNKTTSIDLKNGTLKTSVIKDKNGKTTIKVYDKTTGYVIEDEKSKTTVTGNLKDDGIPDGYAYDTVLKKYVPKSEVGKYVYADATYYDSEGTAVINKGEVVAKETLEKAKKYLTTTKSSKKATTTTTTAKTTTSTTTAKTTTSTTSNEGVVNKDGTYTIHGVTYADKATFQEIATSDLESIDVYLDENGVVHINTNEKQKTLVK